MTTNKLESAAIAYKRRLRVRWRWSFIQAQITEENSETKRAGD